MTEALLPAFQWMEVNLPGGPYLRESTFGFSILLTAHVVAMCWFFGLILMTGAAGGYLLEERDILLDRIFQRLSIIIMVSV